MKFTFAEFRSSEGCCITKHEKSEVHFERNRSSHYFWKFTSNKRQNNSEVQFEQVEVRNIFRSSLATIGKFTYLRTEIHSPYRSSYLKWKFTPYNVEVRLEVQMQIRGSSDLCPEKFRCDGSSLYFLKFTSN